MKESKKIIETNSQNKLNNQSELPNSADVTYLDINKKLMKTRAQVLRRKSILAFVSSFTIILILAVAGYAWYTKNTDTYMMKFDTADYGLSINQEVYDTYEISMYTYNNVEDQTILPGSIGYIPIEISAETSQVDVNYNIMFITKMPPELQKRVKMYYLKDQFGDPIQSISDIALYEKEYINFTDFDENETNGISNIITGTIEKGTSTKLCVYFQWYLDAKEAFDNGIEDVVADKEKLDNGETVTIYRDLEVSTWDEYCEKWDEFDTDIGRYPDKYKDAFSLLMVTDGEQAKPAGGAIIIENEENNN